MATGIRRSGLRDEVYDWLLTQIVSGGLAPGETLTIEGLSSELNVSPTPIREALANFEPTGLLTRVPRKGYRVAPALAPEELAQVLDARMVVEAAAAKRACLRVTPVLIDDLERCVSNHEHYFAALNAARANSSDELPEDTDGYLKADAEFHRLILAECGNPFLASLNESISGQWHRARFTEQHGVRDGDKAIREHKVIIEAFRVGDPDAAEGAMTDHIARVRQDTLDQPTRTAEE